MDCVADIVLPLTAKELQLEEVEEITLIAPAQSSLTGGGGKVVMHILKFE
jgi:hypothetical protein